MIPVFNRASSIAPTLQSVLAQTFSDFECLVIDDGSHDATALQALVSSFRDSRLRYVFQANRGGGAARNLGIEISAGAYIAFLDSDDRFHVDKLAKIASIIVSDPMVVYYSRAIVDRGNGRYWIRPSRPIRAEERVDEYLFAENQFIPTPTLVLSAELAKAVRFDPTLQRGQDLDFCVRLAMHGAVFMMHPEALVTWVDQTEKGRVSKNGGRSQPEAWLARMESSLSRRAFLGYRATVLSQFVAQKSPCQALRYLIAAWALGGVSGAIILRQALRTFLPRQWYRSLVDFIIGILNVGSRRDQEAEDRDID